MAKSDNTIFHFIAYIAVLIMSVIFILSKFQFGDSAVRVLSSIANIISCIVLLGVSFVFARNSGRKIYWILWVIAFILLLLGNIIPFVGA